LNRTLTSAVRNLGGLVRASSAVTVRYQHNGWDGRVFDSVVKVYATVSPPNYFLPWTKKPQRDGTGSGFTIAGKRIMTNAHVVADQSLVMVRKHGSAVKYIAEVEHVGHDCDLAILNVEDESFWEDTPHLEFGPTPELQDQVLVAGYPTGGDTISLSTGVVSRSELQRYAHGGGTHLALQIDASINPGNSGGPALRDDGSALVAGVAFQALNHADRIGYVIPYPVIKHFLDDIERHGKITGFCEFGMRCQPLENPQIRGYFGVPQDVSGICITDVYPLNDTGAKLKVNDILIEVDGLPVANDGTIPFRENERIMLSFALTSRFLGEEVSVKVLRRTDVGDGSSGSNSSSSSNGNGSPPEVLSFDIRLDEVEHLVPAHLYDKTPQYFVHAGLVFVPLTWPFLYEWGDDWYSQGPRKLISRAMDDFPSRAGEQPVVLSQILMDKVNHGYDGLTPAAVIGFNGEKVLNLQHLMTMVLECEDEYLLFEMEDANGCNVVLEREQAKESNSRILDTYGIPLGCSPDLREEYDRLGGSSSSIH